MLLTLLQSQGAAPPPPPPEPAEVRGVPTVPLRSKRRGDEEGWNPPSETEAERVERVLRQRVAMGIVPPPAEERTAPEEAPGVRKTDAGYALPPELSRAAELVPEPTEAPRDAGSGVALAKAELSPEQIEELRMLVQLEARRRNDLALAAILLSVAVH